MSFITKIFAKKEKKPKAKCNLSNTLLEFGEGYQLTTTQLISSKRFWDHKMLEPETTNTTMNQTIIDVDLERWTP